MFSINQTKSIIGYFDMLSTKLFELYKQINKEDNGKIIKAQIADVTLSLVAKSGHEAVLTYVRNNMGSETRKFIRICNSEKTKELYFSVEDCLFVILHEGEIVEVNINNTPQLLNNRQRLKEFNTYIAKRKIAIQNLLDSIATHYEVPGVVVDDFAIPGFALEEKSLTDELSKETILASAIRVNGKYILGNHHADCTNHLGIQRYIVDATVDTDNVNTYTETGYITSFGNFVSSHTAWLIAEQNDLIKENVQCFTKNSEDFYHACGHCFDLALAKRKIIERLKEDFPSKENPQKVLKLSGTNNE